MIHRDTILLQTEFPGKDKAISTAAAAIRDGELVAFPTETVYGLGANVYDEAAVLRIFEAKGRPADNPLIVHVASIEQASELVMELPESFHVLAEKYLPGPLTLVMKRNAAVLDCVTAGLETVAVRMPDHAVALQLIKDAGVPIAAPSANISGIASPVTAAQAYNDLNGKVYAVLDGGPSSVGIESTVLDLSSDEAMLLRPGMISKEELEATLGKTVNVADDQDAKPRSPGMKYVHYAPTVPLVLFLAQVDLRTKLVAEIGLYLEKGKKVALIGPDSFEDLGAASFYSFGSGSAVEYARHLYSALRYFSAEDIDILLCPGIEETGPGLAVMNRLRKASSRIIGP
jgi:L-threonylcarbamoyladenylate synthase